jgi:hypothetical protein
MATFRTNGALKLPIGASPGSPALDPGNGGRLLILAGRPGSDRQKVKHRPTSGGIERWDQQPLEGWGEARVPADWIADAQAGFGTFHAG